LIRKPEGFPPTCRADREHFSKMLAPSEGRLSSFLKKNAQPFTRPWSVVKPGGKFQKGGRNPKIGRLGLKPHLSGHNRIKPKIRAFVSLDCVLAKTGFRMFPPELSQFKGSGKASKIERKSSHVS
jgi:hypothetical protein